MLKIKQYEIKWWERILLSFMESKYNIDPGCRDGLNYIVKYKILNDKVYILSIDKRKC